MRTVGSALLAAVDGLHSGLWGRAVWLTLLSVIGTLSASAHEVRPAYLEIVELGDGILEVTWKQPLQRAGDGARRLRLEPVLLSHCERSAHLPEVAGDALVERWTFDCGESAGDGLLGERIEIAGLSRTLTDALVRIRLADGREITEILRPQRPSLVVSGEVEAPLRSYLRLGIEHLLFGFDHILFVIGLMFLVRRPLELLAVVTSFTVAHSITLALSTLGWVRLSQAPVEAVIALSILFVAVELAHPPQCRSRLTGGRTWMVAFAFGLLHGFGFAGALAEIGLPERSAAWALFLFNLGVELGQLLIVAMILLLLHALGRLGTPASPLLRRAPIYLMGVISAYWFVARVAGLV